jgi:hypothetical protein
MTNEQKTDALRGMFNSTGWEVFTEMLEEAYSKLRLDDLDSLEDLYQAKGEKEVVGFIKSLPFMIEEYSE